MPGVISPPIPIRLGSEGTIPYPNNTELRQLLITNLSPFTLIISNGGDQSYLVAFNQTLIPLHVNRQPIAYTALSPSGTATLQNSTGSILANWYEGGDTIPGNAYPVSLAANAVLENQTPVNVLQQISIPQALYTAGGAAMTITLHNVNEESALLLNFNNDDAGLGAVATVTASGYTVTQISHSTTSFGQELFWYALTGGPGGTVTVDVAFTVSNAYAGASLIELSGANTFTATGSSNDGGFTGNAVLFVSAQVPIAGSLVFWAGYLLNGGPPTQSPASPPWFDAAGSTNGGQPFPRQIPYCYTLASSPTPAGFWIQGGSPTAWATAGVVVAPLASGGNAPAGPFVNSLNGISGIVDLASPNDSVQIAVSGQNIDLESNAFPPPNTGGFAFVDYFGGDPTGTLDSTIAFNNALSSLPTQTYTTAFGTFTYPVGTIAFSGGGTYKINSNSGTVTTETGPLVQIIGLGGTIINDYNDGTVRAACFKCSNFNGFNVLDTEPIPLDTGAGVRNLTLDGTNAASGCIGIVVESGEGWVVDEVTIAHYTVGTGLYLKNDYWLEKSRFRIYSLNNLFAVQVGADSAQSSPNSFEYCRIEVDIIAYPGQNGVVLSNWATLNGGEIIVRGDFLYDGNSYPQNHVVQFLGGAQMTAARWLVSVELNALHPSSGSTTFPRTLGIDTTNGSVVLNASGSLDYRNGNWLGAAPGSGSFSPSNFTFTGTIDGDPNISGGATRFYRLGNAGGVYAL